MSSTAAPSATTRQSGSVDRATTQPRFHPLRADVLVDPYPTYARLREEAPVLWDRRFGWVVFGYEDVAASLKDPRLSARRPGPDDPIPRLLQPIASEVRELRYRQGQWLLCTDAPDHTRLRTLLGAAFSPRMVQRMRLRIQDIVNGLLDRAHGAREFDLIADFAYPLPATIIAELLGVPTADLDLFKSWSDDLAGSFTWAPDTMRRAHAAIEELTAYVGGLVARQRQAPGDTLLGALLQAQTEGAGLGDEELVAQGVMLLFAAHETITGLIGNATLALLRHPDQLARLRTKPPLIESAVEELLRFDSPTQATFRSVAADVELRGQHLRQGEPVLLMLGSANRDPVQFVEPDALDLGRRDNRHLAFSHGPHFCLGAALARLEGRVALATLVRRFPNLRLLETELRWRPNVFLRGLESLLVGA